MLNNLWDDGYGMVPRKLFADTNLKTSAKLVMTYFLTFTGSGKNVTYPKVDTICKQCGLSKKTVISAIDSLEYYGYISRKKRYEDQPFNQRKEYQIHVFYGKDEMNYTMESVKITPSESVKITPSHINNNIKVKDTATPQAKLVNLFKEQYKKKYNTEYIESKKDYILISSLLKKATQENLEDKMLSLFTQDYWFIKSSPATVGVFVSHINEIAAPAAEKKLDNCPACGKLNYVADLRADTNLRCEKCGHLWKG